MCRCTKIITKLLLKFVFIILRNFKFLTNIISINWLVNRLTKKNQFGSLKIKVSFQLVVKLFYKIDQ